MSRKRFAVGGAIVIAALAVIYGSLQLPARNGPTAVDATANVHVTGDEISALEHASCPPQDEVLRAGRFTPAEVARAKRGRFVINGRTVDLEPPVDWTMNPQHARSFAHNLFKFQWIDPLIYAYEHNGDVKALQQATNLVLDFAHANPPDGNPVDPDIWDDKRTGDRGPYMAYILRAAQCEGLLDHGQRELLLALMERHVNVLTDPQTYKETNHGLFVDLGLTLLARQLDSQPNSSSWGDLGRERFASTFHDKIVEDEGFWLEHSSGYQILVTRTLKRFLEIPGNYDAGLAAVLKKMQDVVGWLREPDGKIPQWGDSDLKTVPDFGVTRSRDDSGILDLHDSGVAIVKEPGAWFGTIASYFSDAHKHADALTFDLFDEGRRLITDTGLYAKDKDENFAFAHSTRAHSVLTVDGADFPRDGSRTYGSGLEATGKGHGVYAVLGTNPATHEQGVDHHRLFVYEPHRYLIVADHLEADAEHRYVRFLQFAPGVDVRRDEGGKGLALSAPNFHGYVRTSGAGRERIELAKGEHDPLRGLTSPSFRKWVPRWTARLRSKAEDLSPITTMTLSGPPIEAKLRSWQPTGQQGVELDLRRGGKPYEHLRIRQDGGSLAVDVHRADGARRPAP